MFPRQIQRTAALSKLQRLVIPKPIHCRCLSRIHTVPSTYHHHRIPIHSFSTTPVHHLDPTDSYEALVRSGDLRRDKAQEIVVKDLQTLYERIEKYEPPPLPDSVDGDIPSGTFASVSPKNVKFAATNNEGFFSRWFAKSEPSPAESSPRSLSNPINGVNQRSPQLATYQNCIVPNGLYVYGSTGTGKTMLMDLFYESIESQTKQRVHFNKFMLDIHDKIHQWRIDLKARGLAPKEMKKYDPIPEVSLAIAKESTVLCFDEFQVTDIVDAVLLNRLFTCLFHYGIVVLATSNRHPNQLYLNGLQRKQVFEPFLTLFESRMDYIDLNSIDYRDTGTNLRDTYFYPSSNNGEMNRFEMSWQRILHTSANKAGEHSTTINVMAGRTLHCPRVVGNSKAARFKFEELCSRSLGTADYNALSTSFATVFIEDIPKFNLENRNEMKRFILLIDELYNSKNRLVCLSSAEPIALLDLPNSNNADKAKNTFEDIFQFDRCVSRLLEMQSAEYLETFHKIWRDDESQFAD